MADLHFETKLVHAGHDPAAHQGAATVPIYSNAAFAYDTAQELSNVFKGREFGYVYSRIGNPTVTAFEQRVNSLEDGIGAAAVASGMGAISATLMALTESGDEVITGCSLFGGTLRLFEDVFKKFGVGVKYVDGSDPEAIRAAISPQTRAVYVESLGNPRLDVPDLARIGAITREEGIPLIVDSTMTTPYLLSAKKLGADIVVHSATKYMTGNGSAVGGVLVDTGNFDWKESKTPVIREAAGRMHPSFAFLSVVRTRIIHNTGACLAPFNAYLHQLGLETLGLRMERHCQNALDLAASLAEEPAVKGVSYPGLKDHPFHRIAKEQFSGHWGGLLTLELGSAEAAFGLIDRLQLVLNLANLGDTRTLIIHPASTIYQSCSEEERQAAGVTPGLVRISVGLEHIEDLKNDFKQALAES